MNYRQRLEIRIPQVESIISSKNLPEKIALAKEMLSKAIADFDELHASLSHRFPESADQLEHAVEETLELSRLSMSKSHLKNDIDLATLEKESLDHQLAGLRRDLSFYQTGDCLGVSEEEIK